MRSQQLLYEVGGGPHGRGGVEFADGGLRARFTAGGHDCRDAQSDESLNEGADEQVCRLLPFTAGERAGQSASEVEGTVGVVQPEVSGVQPLGREHGERHPPALADRAEPVGVRYEDVVEIDLVEAGSPVIWRMGRTVTPGASIRTRKTVMPACLGTPGSVRQTATPQVATRAPDVQTL